MVLSVGRILFSAVLILCVFIANAETRSSETDHTVVRRVSVFPIQAPPEMAEVAEDVWWEVRDLLTKDKRFLVASKNFLLQKDVHQSRGPLSPADAIILGKLLDANALMTIFLKERILHMHVYEGDFGRPLWTHELTLQPSLPIAQQLKPASIKLAQDFIASFPYQGYVVTDPLIGRPLYTEGRRMMIKGEVSENAELEVGDPAQLIHVNSDTLKPLFTQGTAVEVYAEGRVVERDRQKVVIELDRLNRSAQVLDGALIRLPHELKRLKQMYTIQDSLRNKIDPSFFSPGMTSAKQQEAETKPLVASLLFIGNLAAFLLLAF